MWSYVVVAGYNSATAHNERVAEVTYAIGRTGGTAEIYHSPGPWNPDAVSTFQVDFTDKTNRLIFHVMASPIWDQEP